MTDFEQVYQAYFGDVYRYLRALCGDDDLAEELTAETFTRALAALDSYRGGCSIRVWLCQIGKNCWYSWLRRRSREQPLDELTAAEEPQAGGDPETLAADGDAAMRLHRLLHSLPDPYKEVFSLRVFGELSFAQIGELFGKTANWACVTFHRAKQKLQNGMEGFES